MPRKVSREEFDKAVEAVWSEIEYQNKLPRRSDADEAKDVPGFCTLTRVYLSRVESDWADNPATYFNGVDRAQVPQAIDGLRKLAAIAVRAMVYNGILKRLPQ